MSGGGKVGPKFPGALTQAEIAKHRQPDAEAKEAKAAVKPLLATLDRNGDQKLDQKDIDALAKDKGAAAKAIEAVRSLHIGTLDAAKADQQQHPDVFQAQLGYVKKLGEFSLALGSALGSHELAAFGHLKKGEALWTEEKWDGAEAEMKAANLEGAKGTSDDYAIVYPLLEHQATLARAFAETRSATGDVRVTKAKEVLLSLIQVATDLRKLGSDPSPEVRDLLNQATAFIQGDANLLERLRQDPEVAPLLQPRSPDAQ